MYRGFGEVLMLKKRWRWSSRNQLKLGDLNYKLVICVKLSPMFIPKSLSHVSLHEEVFLSSDPPIIFNLGDLSRVGTPW
jgi:hypothetical protein